MRADSRFAEVSDEIDAAVSRCGRDRHDARDTLDKR